MPTCERVYGVDFSGAVDAGRRIWIARGVPTPAGLRLESCQPAAALPGAGPDRPRALAALRALIAAEPASLFGFDFPFSLPAAIVRTAFGAARWVDFALGLADRCPTAAAFRAVCQAATGGRTVRRQTDLVARTPFAPDNLRIYRQTYVGIASLLAPLVQADAACVLPFQSPRPGRAWLAEVCPASTLKRLGLYRPYKGRDEARVAQRRRMLEHLEQHGALTIATPALRATILTDPNGDALDSVIAAWATRRFVAEPAARRAAEAAADPLEGCVYA